MKHQNRTSTFSRLGTCKVISCLRQKRVVFCDRAFAARVRAVGLCFAGPSASEIPALLAAADACAGATDEKHAGTDSALYAASSPSSVGAVSPAGGATPAGPLVGTSEAWTFLETVRDRTPTVPMYEQANAFARLFGTGIRRSNTVAGQFDDEPHSASVGES